jgi:probable rRNA maturation factor
MSLLTRSISPSSRRERGRKTTLAPGRPDTRPPARSRRQTPTVDIVVVSPLWRTRRGVRAMLRRAIAAAASAALSPRGELAIVLTDDATIRALNRAWRAKDAVTNVLSFPAKEPHPGRGTSRLLGDIVIAYETTQREARAERKPFAHHLAHLVVHGFLHLAGHDHQADDEAVAMERLEAAILARLDVPDPYITRGAD